jgi:hypothetical protein
MERTRETGQQARLWPAGRSFGRVRVTVLRHGAA